MMIRKPSFTGILMLSLYLNNQPLQAAQLFRFIDENGTPTLSKSLPPEAAQQGYDVLDDKTMQLIKQVPAALNEKQRASKAEQELQQLQDRQKAQQQAKIIAESQRRQSIQDNNLLAIYQSETDLIVARDKDLAYRLNKIDILKMQQPELKEALNTLQHKAAGKELSGKSLSVNLQKRLNAAEAQLNNNRSLLQQLKAEVLQLTQQYELDRQRLLEIL